MGISGPHFSRIKSDPVGKGAREAQAAKLSAYDVSVLLAEVGPSFLIDDYLIAADFARLFWNEHATSFFFLFIIYYYYYFCGYCG